MKRCFCFGAMDFTRFDEKIKDGDIVIAADGGLKACEKFNIEPTYILGDFDSLGYVPDSDNVTRLPVEKDVTDMYQSAFTAFEKGYREIHLYGGVGGRPDHTYANIALVADLTKRGCRCFLVSDTYIITAVTDGGIDFGKEMRGTISVFSFDNEARGVSETGLKYTLDNAELTNDFPLGVSNSFVGENAHIGVENGTLIIMYERP